MAGQIIVCTLIQRTKVENYSYKNQHQNMKHRLWPEINSFPSNSSLIRSVLSMFRRKTDTAIPSKLEIDALIPAVSSHFLFIAPFLNWT